MSMHATTAAEHATIATMPSPEQLFELGIMYSTGRAMPLDMVSAHKFFNIAASRGMKDAARLRNEVASEMSSTEIAAAQRAARDWMMRH